METEIIIFRVRPTFKNIKKQKGAFLLFEAAVECAKKTKCNVYDGHGRCLFEGKRSIFKKKVEI